MGFRFRKSINLGGGFRVNLSKSGVGYSWGTKGYRVTKTATGQTRTTYSIPGTGISYVKQNSKKKKPQTLHPNPANATKTPIDNNLLLGAESEVNCSNQVEFINKINESIKKFNITWLFASLFIVLTIIQPFCALLFLLLIPIYIYSISKRVIYINYDLDENSAQKYNTYLQSFMNINNSKKLWLVNKSDALHDMQHRKANAGAGRLINRVPLSYPSIIGPKKIIRQFYIKTNVNCIILKISKTSILFLPDMILFRIGKSISGTAYENLHFSNTTTRYIEDGVVPKDSEVIDYTWQYVNKNGTPDKRYNNNRRLPIVKYGVLHFSSENLNIEIQTSNASIPAEIKENLISYSYHIQSLTQEINKMQASQDDTTSKLINENISNHQIDNIPFINEKWEPTRRPPPVMPPIMEETFFDGTDVNLSPIIKEKNKEAKKPRKDIDPTSPDALLDEIMPFVNKPEGSE